jgi:hypothetical protein
VQSEDLDSVVGVGWRIDAAQGHLPRAAATLGGEVLSGMVDEDSSHHLRGDAIELRAILPLPLALIDEAHVCLVDEGRGLQGMAGVLAPHGGCRSSVKLSIYDWKQALAGSGVAGPPGLQ